MINTVVDSTKFFIEVGTGEWSVFRAVLHNIDEDTYLLEDELMGGMFWTQENEKEFVLVEMDKGEYMRIMQLYKNPSYDMEHFNDEYNRLIEKYQ